MRRSFVVTLALLIASSTVGALIDEYQIQFCPTLLGEGRRLFPSPTGPANLERVGTRTYDTGVVFLHYEPRRAK